MIPDSAAETSQWSPDTVGGNASPPAPAAEALARAQVQVLFAPAVMLYNSSIRVFLDGLPIGAGSFNGGLDVTTAADMGRHTLEVRIEVARGITRHRSYELVLESACTYRATLTYSRLWGTFSKKINLQKLP